MKGWIGHYLRRFGFYSGSTKVLPGPPKYLPHQWPAESIADSLDAIRSMSKTLLLLPICKGDPPIFIFPSRHVAEAPALEADLVIYDSADLCCWRSVFSNVLVWKQTCRVFYKNTNDLSDLDEFNSCNLWLFSFFLYFADWKLLYLLKTVRFCLNYKIQR